MEEKKLLESHVLGVLVVNLYSTDSLDERFSLYSKVVEYLGFDAVCYSFAPRSSLNPSLQKTPIFKFSGKFPTSFLTQYEEEDFHKSDFTIREIQENKLNPKDWKEYETMGILNDSESRVVQIARDDHGIKNAISIPTMNHSIGIAGASIISFKEDIEFKELKLKNLEVLIGCTKVFSDMIVLQSPTHVLETFVLNTLPQITATEKIILRDLILGYPIYRIANEEDISASAVSNHLLRLRKKFQVKKTSELKQLLGSLNILDYL